MEDVLILGICENIHVSISFWITSSDISKCLRNQIFKTIWRSQKKSVSRISTIENLFRGYKCTVANMILRKVENILKMFSISWAIDNPHNNALPLFCWVIIAYLDLQRIDWLESGWFGRQWIFCVISSFSICQPFLFSCSNCFHIYIEHSSRLIFSNFDLPQIHVLQACILWFFNRRKKCRKIVYFELSGW